MKSAVALHLKKLEETWIPFTQLWFVQSLVEMGPVVLDENVKSLQTDRWTNRRRTPSEKLKSF